MSLAAFQASLAALLRCPEAWCPGGDLSPAEKASLRVLAADHEVGKYAREQREQRWRATWRKIPRLGQTVGEETLRGLWLGGFDPKHQLVTSDATTLAGAYSLAFLDWLSDAPEAAEALAAAGSPPWVLDVVAFEKAEIELTLPVDLGAFRVAELRHDLLSAGEPAARRTLAALVRQGVGRRPRVFEIDDAFAAVLRGLDGSGPPVEPDETALAALSVMGLAPHCRAAGSEGRSLR